MKRPGNLKWEASFDLSRTAESAIPLGYSRSRSPWMSREKLRCTVMICRSGCLEIV